MTYIVKFKHGIAQVALDPLIPKGRRVFELPTRTAVREYNVATSIYGERIGIPVLSATVHEGTLLPGVFSVY